MSPDPTPSKSAYDFTVVRLLRKREKLTLNQLSERSGVSVAVISKLERNQTSAELDTLGKIAGVFGMTTSDLVGLAESPLAHRKQADGYASSEFFFHRIRYANHTCLLGEAPKGAKLNRPDVHGDDNETCWVIQGKIRLVVQDQIIDLAHGESVQFDAIRNHTYEALEDSIFIILHLKKSNRF